ncbi:hypothetical protein ABZP36_002982 [Zizania latifolia]
MHAGIRRSHSKPHLHLRTNGQQDWFAALTTLTAATSSSEASSNSRFVLLLDPSVTTAAHSEEPSDATSDRTGAHPEQSPHRRCRRKTCCGGCSVWLRVPTPTVASRKRRAPTSAPATKRTLLRHQNLDWVGGD